MTLSSKNTLLAGLCCVLAVPAFCQPITAVPNNVRARTTMQSMLSGNELGSKQVIYGFPAPPGKVIGDSYLSKNWQTSSILLYEDDKLLEGYPVRYDIQLDELEIKGQGGVKVLEGNKIKSFSLVDSLSKKAKYYVNAKEYKMEDGTPFLGFFEVMVDGKLPLLRMTNVDVKRANYSVHFDVGSRDDVILKSTKLYTSSNNVVTEVPSSQKKLLAMFGDKEPKISKFIKVNTLNVADPYHLTRIFELYNSL